MFRSQPASVNCHHHQQQICMGCALTVVLIKPRCQPNEAIGGSTLCGAFSPVNVARFGLVKSFIGCIPLGALLTDGSFIFRLKSHQISAHWLLQGCRKWGGWGGLGHPTFSVSFLKFELWKRYCFLYSFLSL